MKISTRFPIFWIILLVVFVSAIAATYDYVKINQAQKLIIENQAIQAQRSINYIDCLVHINPQQSLPSQEATCYKGLPQVKK